MDGYPSKVSCGALPAIHCHVHRKCDSAVPDIQCLLILLIIRSVNGPNEQLDQPKLWCQGDTLPLHLLCFQFVVACSIHQIANLRVIVQLGKECLRPGVSANLQHPNTASTFCKGPLET